MHIIFENVLMPSTKNYHNWSILVKTTACQNLRVFETQCTHVYSTPPYKFRYVV